MLARNPLGAPHCPRCFWWSGTACPLPMDYIWLLLMTPHRVLLLSCWPLGSLIHQILCEWGIHGISGLSSFSVLVLSNLSSRKFPQISTTSSGDAISSPFGFLVMSYGGVLSFLWGVSTQSALSSYSVLLPCSFVVSISVTHSFTQSLKSRIDDSRISLLSDTKLLSRVFLWVHLVPPPVEESPGPILNSE